MITNKYYILNLPEPALNAILSHCVESAETARSNKDNTKHVVKLPIGSGVPAVLKSKTEYNHTEILQELNTSEWQSDII